MTLSLSVQCNGPAIDLIVSRDQRTFAQAISNEYVAVLGPDTIAYSTVTKDLRQPQFPPDIRQIYNLSDHGVGRSDSVGDLTNHGLRFKSIDTSPKETIQYAFWRGTDTHSY